MVVPLYLAECLSANERGRGTGVFQWLLTFGIFVAACIGIYYSYHVAEVARTATPRRALPGEGPRLAPHLLDVDAAGNPVSCWAASLCPNRRAGFSARASKTAAHAALLRSRTAEQAALEMEEMEQIARETARSRDTRQARPDWSQIRILQRRYVLPFLLACVILFCNTATGINSVIGFNTDILLQSGLSDVMRALGLCPVHPLQLSSSPSSA